MAPYPQALLEVEGLYQLVAWQGQAFQQVQAWLEQAFQREQAYRQVQAYQQVQALLLIWQPWGLAWPLFLELIGQVWEQVFPLLSSAYQSQAQSLLAES